MKENRKKNIRVAVLILILFLGIGFAALTTQLKIDGAVNVSRTSWDVHFENVSITEGSVNASPAPVSDDATTTEMEYGINFTKPGDYFEFTTDIVNDGTIDAMVDVVSNNAYANASSTTPITLPSYLRSTTTYDDGTPISQNQELLHGTSEKIKVRVEFRTDINPSDLPSSGDTSVVFKFKADYKQKNENSVPVGINFSTVTWDEITTTYATNPAKLEQTMKNGTMREIEMDIDGDGTNETYHLRIANVSTPEECSTTGFSQSACGLVLEFADIITKHRMNKSNVYAEVENGNGSKGGWKYSDMRAYLNNTTYAYENIDYSTTGLYSKLPSDLKSKIINTTVVSGYNSNDSANFTTTDKLYLLSLHEIYEDRNKDSSLDPYRRDTAYNSTRQLDYYKLKGVTASNYSEAAKKYNGSYYDWWIRSTRSDSVSNFDFVSSYGYKESVGSVSYNGVSPAFRIA